MSIDIRFRPVLPILASAILAAGCSTPQGYGVMSPRADEEAIMRQQIANQEPAANNRGMYLSLIQELQGKGSYFASLAHIDAFEQKYGTAPDVELLRGHALREAGQAAEAEAVYRKLLGTSVAAAASQGLGLIAAARGDYGASVAALRDAARRDPTNALIVNDLGYALLQQGDWRGARLPIAQAAELAPDNPKILGNLALLLLVTGNPERADAVMAKAGLSSQSQTAVRSMASDLLARQAYSGAPAPKRTAEAPKQAEAAPRAVATPAVTVRAVPAPMAPQMSRVPGTEAQEATRPAPAASVPVRASGNSIPIERVAPVAAPMERMLDRFGSPP